MSENEIIEDPSKTPRESSVLHNTNQIYFYDDVSRESIFNLNREIDIISKNLLTTQINLNLKEVPPIDLFVSSEGGEIFSAFSAVDRIKINKVPVHSCVEGVAASAATLISVCCHKRFIRENSFMLIHQLSSAFWGNFEQIQDESKNLKLLMDYIKNIYIKHTKFTIDELDNLLKHDIYLNAKQCLAHGLVDDII
jgi:ATP-dependent protease ClpP protease subunit